MASRVQKDGSIPIRAAHRSIYKDPGGIEQTPEGKKIGGRNRMVED